MTFKYPVALELQDRTCVVIGGGQLAEHKAGSLIEAGARVRVISQSFTQGLEELARRGSIELTRKPYSDGDLEGAFLAIAATDDGVINSQVYEEAEKRHVLLNAVDDVEHCHFAVPSIIRHGDFILSISTGGKAPALAKRLRIELSETFGPEYGVLVDLLGEERSKALPERKVSFEEWACRWQSALDADLLGLVRAGQFDRARGIVAQTLTSGSSGAGASGSSGAGASGGQPFHDWPDGYRRIESRVSIVGAGPGDPGLITVRGRELIEQADVIVYDRLVHPSLVEGRVAIYVGKEPGKHSLSQGGSGGIAAPSATNSERQELRSPRDSQDQINRMLVDLARTPKRVVRLKGGDPFVFGRGAEEAEALAEAGIPFEIVPAPSSAFAAPAYAGIPVTDRRYASSVSIVTARSAQSDTKSVDWGPFVASGGTLVILMGAERVGEIGADLIRAGLDPSTPAAIIENGTLQNQRVVTAAVSELGESARREEVRAPATIVIGDVVRLRTRISWFAPRITDMAKATSRA